MRKFGNFLSSFSVKKLLSNKRFTVTLSAFLAFVLWLIIVTNENPTIERSFADMNVNINLENTLVSENGMSIIGDISSQKFTVVVRGPTYLISSLKSDDFNIYASAASVDAPGEYKLEVTATPKSSNKGYEILSVTPSTIKISFDYIDTKEFTVKALAEGATAEKGLIAENAVVSGTEKDTVTITGPRSVINKIDSVAAYTKVNKTLSASETFDADIKLYDTENKEIKSENLTLSQTGVKVTVPISKKKTVPVVVDFTNLPKGFNKKSLSYDINYKNVTVIGTPETVDKTENVVLSPIDISKVSNSSKSFDVSPKLPDGVRLIDNIEHFTVKLEVNDYVQKNLNVSEIRFENLGKGLKATGDRIKNVKVFGPKKAINGLKSGEVYALADLSNKKAGEHSVEVLICFKNDDDIWALGSYTAAIVIK